MSGGIEFEPEKSWIVATWVYGSVIDFARGYVPRDLYPNLYSLMTEEENPINFIFLNELSEDEKTIFSYSLKKGFEKATKNNVNGFANKMYYVNFMERFKELIEMLPP